MSTDLAAAAPPLEGMDYYYGLWVTSLGDDESLIVAGHPPLMRAVAAMNCYSRLRIGLKDLTDGDKTTLAVIASMVEYRWAVRQTHEDCSDRERDLEADGQHWCAMCEAIDDSWWIVLHETEQPNSFPVTVWST